MMASTRWRGACSAVGLLLALVEGSATARMTSERTAEVLVAPLLGEGGRACAVVLGASAAEAGWSVIEAEQAEPAGRRFAPRRRWIRQVTAESGARWALVGTLGEQKMVLELYTAEGHLVGLRGIRTAGRCGLTRRGHAAVERLLREGAARTEGVPPYAFEREAVVTPTISVAAGPPSVPDVSPPAKPAPSMATPMRASADPSRTGSAQTPSRPAQSPPAQSPPARSSPAASSGSRRDLTEEIEAEPSSRLFTVRPSRAVRLEVGFGLLIRDTRFFGVRDPRLLNLDAPGAAELELRLSTQPFVGISALEGLEISAAHAETLGQRARRGEGSYELRQQRSSVHLGWRLPVHLGEAAVELVPRVGARRWVSALERGAEGRFPDVETLTAEVGANVATLALDALEISGGVSFLPVFDAGPVERVDALGPASGSAVAWRVSLEFIPENIGLGVLAEGQSLRLEGEAPAAAQAMEDDWVHVAAFLSLRG